MTLTAVLRHVKEASQTLPLLPEQKINAVLRAAARALVKNTRLILAANQKDLSKLFPGIPLYARLILTAKKIKQIARGFEEIARFPSPLNRVIEARTLKNGLKLSRVTVPLGVIGIIYEARPNVTADVFALCFKSGNACVLKGGAEALHSSAAIIKIIQAVLKKHKITPHTVHLITGGRREAQQLMVAAGLVDVIIPRGSQALINYVRAHATVPVIETGAGVVHAFVDASADVEPAARIIYNAKTSNPAICNSLDTLLIHKTQLKNLARLVKPLIRPSVELFADKPGFAALKNSYPKPLLHRAGQKHFDTEFLSLRMAVKTVAGLDEALAHIARHSTKHSEAILSRNQTNVARFLREVDAATVFANTSTRFSDGGVFGLGAEIGISTQKLHARGPMGLSALTSYKWVGQGRGQIRE